MARWPATARTANGGGYVGWEEVYVCNEKGRREIHYTMKRRDGGKDLAVIAKERSLRHMTYRFLLDFNDDGKTSTTTSFCSSGKPRSRRELIDWLNSFLPDSQTHVPPRTSGGSSDANEPNELDVEIMRDSQLRKVGVSKPRKRLRLARDDWKFSTLPIMEKDVPMEIDTGIDEKKGPLLTVSRTGVNSVTPHQATAVGSEVEVLSQDSGMRGCWFRATVIKKHKNKVKLSYHDIKDAENEENCLQEWVLASRIAVRDVMGLRLDGRTTIRPSFQLRKGRISWAFNIGTVVDAWRHDGWWEGIVIEKQPGDNFRVYFPGEKQEAVFGSSDIRHSLEWMENTWKELSEKPDVAASILCSLAKEETPRRSNDMKPEHYTRKENLPINTNESNPTVPDLLKDDFLSQLKWKTSGKRRRNFFSVQRLHPCARRVSSERTLSHRTKTDLLTIKVRKDNSGTTKVSRDKFKFTTPDSIFNNNKNPSVIPPPPITSLLMSR